MVLGDKPNSIVVDANGSIWVLCGGYNEYDANWNIVSQTPGTLHKIINPYESVAPVATFTFPVGHNPKELNINEAGTELYFLHNSAVYSMNINDNILPSTPVVDRGFYGLGVKNGYIYGSDAGNYVDRGWSYRYLQNGSFVDSVEVGVAPGGYFFN